MKVKVYVEGGGEKKDGEPLKNLCREGFQKFFEKAGLTGQMPQIIPCGSRDQAYRNFCRALADPDVLPILLVDSEAPVKQNSVWNHLRERDQWQRPASVNEEQAHLMVQCMESWFLADKDCLETYFGQHFHQNALPRNPKIEEIPKPDIFDGLKNATRQCEKQYHKGKHSFKILARLDPGKVSASAPYAKRLIEIPKRATS